MYFLQFFYISFQDDIGGPRQFVCGACPFESRSRAKLMHHKQFHKPKGLPFRCPHCTYNVTRRHLLSQHIRVHGIEDTMEGNGNGDISQIDDRSNSPSPSLTITPVTNAATVSTGEDSALTDSSNLPKLTDESTTCMEDIPLVWVSRDHRFFKMFKCRHCPHVNLRKTNIQEHEKMHKTDISKEAGGLHCPYCSYVSVNAGVMSAHLKVHGGSMGQCHAVVDPSLSDEDQLKQLTSKGPTASTDIPQTQTAVDKSSNWKNDEKILYYCQHCPARFFLEKEIQIHSRFHNTNLPHTCDHCNYGTRQPAHLLTHLKVHTPEYQQRTRSMMGQHRTAANYPPVPGLTIPQELAVDLAGDKRSSKEGGSGLNPLCASPPPSAGVMPQPPPTSKYMCDQCPATFSKLVTLQYHQSLHGTKNPHPCPKCTYAGKTWDSLQQHIQLHNQYDQNCQAEKEANESAKKAAAQNSVEVNLSPKNSQKIEKTMTNSSIPPLKLKLIGPRPGTGDNNNDGSHPRFKYYVEEQVPLSGVDLLRRKTQMEKEGDSEYMRPHVFSKNRVREGREDMEEEDPKRIGDPQLHYPLHIDRVTGKSREKRYKCNKCPSAFEKVEQYTVHTNLHGSNHKYRCRICDYSVKFYANFMMHIKRHKYHERMEAQTNGVSPPLDNDSKYEPIIHKENSSQGEKAVSSKTQSEEHSNKENVEDADLTTIERQHLLIQNKKGGGEASKKDDEKERRVYYCQFCPYANIRRDAVDSHSLRHRANGGFGSYKCTFCDYIASQPNFIREHTKVHFRPFKYVHPEGFMRHERQEIFSIPIGSGLKGNSKLKKEGGSQSVQEKYVVFSHEGGNANPAEESEGEEEDNVNPEMVKSIQVNFQSGDIVEAPLDFVISLRPKPKASNLHLEASDIPNNSSEASEKTEGMNPGAAESSTNQKNISQSNGQAPQENESMEVDESSVSKEEKTEIAEDSGRPASPAEGHVMETESQQDSENVQNSHVEEKQATKATLKCKENVKMSESKLSELTQPLKKNKESTQSES